MRRRLLATITGLALALTPVAAFAQDAETAPGTEAEPTVLELLAEAVTDWTQALLDGRAADEAQEPAPEAEAEPEEPSAFEELVDSLQTAVSDVFSALLFERVEAEALAETEEAEEDGDGANGEAVSTVAHCAPRGSFKALVEGMANHGEYVTAAAHGETVGLFVPTVETDEESGEITVTPGEEATEFDLSTVEGAEALCDALDVVYQARLLQLELAWEDVDVSRDARVLAREQCRIERLRARNGGESDANEICAELRDRVRELHEAERDERRAAHDEARAARAAERDERKAEREADRAAAREARENRRNDR